MRRIARWIGVGVVVGLLLAVGISGVHVGAQETGEIKLGAFMPLSGISADVGAQIKAGAEVAVERAHEQGVKLGGKPYRVRVIWYDTEGKGDVGLNVVTRALTVDKIHAGVGFLSSDVFIRVMDEFQKAPVPVVDCCAASLKIGDKIAANKMGYVFQLSPTANDIARSLAAAVALNAKPKKIALLNENTDAGRDFSRITRDWFQQNAKDVEVVADEFVDRGVTDLTPQLAKVKRVGAQVILGEIYGSSGPVLFTQWFELRVPAVVAHMGATVAAQTFIDQHAKAMEGAIVNNRWWPARYSEVSEPMMAAYRKKTGTDPTNFAVQAHDATLVALDAIAKSGSLDPDKIRAAIEGGTFAMAWGTRKFTPLAEGHRMPIQTVVIQVQGGKKVPIYPAEVAAKADGKYVVAPPYAWEKK
jgi:branched-chain amino acid transport system substrate-binding protein